MTRGLGRLGAARRRAADRRRPRALRGRRDRRGRRRDAPSDALRRRGDRARASSTRTPTSSTRSTPASATARRSGRGSRPTSRARTCSTTTTCSRSRGAAPPTRSRSGITTVGRLQLLRRCGDARPRELGLRAIVYLEVFAQRPGGGRGAQFEEKRARIDESPLVRIGVSPHAPYTCSLEVYAGASRSASRSARIWPRRRARTSGSQHGDGPAGGDRAAARAADGQARGRRRSSRCSGPTSSAPTASRSTTARSPCSPRAACRSPTARARTPCSAAASRRSRSCAPRGSRVGLGTDSPASTPSFDVFEEMRAAIFVARARERRAEALSRGRGARARDARRGPRPANRRRGGYPDARQARRPDGRVARGEPLPSGRGSRGGRRLRRLAGTSARDDRRRPDPLPKRETRIRGERYAAPQAPPGARCSGRST